MHEFSANLNVMIKAARMAGARLVRDFGEVENLQVLRKGPGDFVTKADKKAEEIIRSVLTEARPNYGWVGEESEPVAGEDPTRRWIVDPLDGTNNFLHGNPFWSISIALEHKGIIIAGVIFSPILGELFIAEKGSGAWMNDARIRVSGRHDLSDMALAASIPCTGRGSLARALQDIAQIAPRASAIRNIGSAALELAYVASGRLDGCWTRSVNIWDIAAGVIILKEAGGFIGSFGTANNPLTDNSYIAANANIFDQLSAELRGSK